MTPTAIAACEFQLPDKGPRTQALYAAINRVQAVIEFSLDGHVLHANENFLHTSGYSLQEVQNRHHRMVCTPELVRSAEHRNFWADLSQGRFQNSRCMRLGKRHVPKSTGAM